MQGCLKGVINMLKVGDIVRWHNLPEDKIKVVDIEYSHVAQEDMYMFSNGMYLTAYEVEMYLKKGVMKKW